MIVVIATICCNGCRAGYRVYSTEDKRTYDIGKPAFEKMQRKHKDMIGNNLGSNYDKYAMIRILNGYRYEYGTEVENNIFDDVEQEKRFETFVENRNNLVVIEREVCEYKGKSISVVKAVTYQGKEVIITETDINRDTTWEENKSSRKGLRTIATFSNIHILGKMVDGKLPESHPLYKTVAKEDLLGTNIMSVVYLMGETLLLKYNDPNITEWTIPDCITMVARQAFKDCDKLQVLKGKKLKYYAEHYREIGVRKRNFEAEPDVLSLGDINGGLVACISQSVLPW